MPREPRVDEHDVVSNLLRDFVGDDGRGGDPAQARLGQKRRSDEHPIAEIVDAVAHQHAPAAATGLVFVKAVVVVVGVVFVVVAMAIELGFFQQEKKHQTRQQGHKQGVWRLAGLEGFGQHVQQGRAQQHPRGQAHQVAHDQAQQGRGQGRRQQDRDQTADEGGENDERQDHCLDLINPVKPALAGSTWVTWTTCATGAA